MLSPEEERENVATLDGETGGAVKSTSGAHFEDPVSVYAFTRSDVDLKRMESVPWDMDHQWNGDEHSHTHLEVRAVRKPGSRLRSRSEGEPASLHSIPLSQQVLMEGDESEDKGQHGI